MHALAAATLAALPDRQKAAVGRLTGMVYTLTQDELRGRVREDHRAELCGGCVVAGCRDPLA